MIGRNEMGGQIINIHLTLPQEKLAAFYLAQVLRESRGLGLHIRCHWLHLSLLLMKLAFQAQSEFQNYKDWKEDLKRRSVTAT